MMPGVDFDRLRHEISIRQVLEAIGFAPIRQRGDQWYGACPLHDPVDGRRGYFSVNIATQRYKCHRCGSRGNQLELWAAFVKHPLHTAAIELCDRLGRPVPWITRW